MGKMDKATTDMLEHVYGEPLADRAEIERRFGNAIAQIDIGRVLRSQSERQYNERCYSPPYEDKIGIYFGDGIESVDEWDRELYDDFNEDDYVSSGWCNEKRIMFRGEWAAYVLADEYEGEYNMKEYLEFIVSGRCWDPIQCIS